MKLSNEEIGLILISLNKLPLKKEVMDLQDRLYEEEHSRQYNITAEGTPYNYL